MKILDNKISNNSVQLSNDSIKATHKLIIS